MADQTKVLRYYLKRFHDAKTDHEATDIVVDKLYYLFKGLWSGHHEIWSQARVNYFAQRDKLYVTAKHQLKKTISDIKSDLDQTNLLNVPAIRQDLCCLDAMLTSRRFEREVITCSDCGASEVFHRPYALPFDLYGLAEGIKALCVNILKQGNWKLLIKYARIISTPKHPNEFTGPLHIYTFVFAPAYFELMEFDQIPAWGRRGNAETPSWVAWDTIFCVWWAIIKGREFLKRKQLDYSDIDERELSAYRLYLHGLKVEVNAVKNKKQQKYKTYLCTQNNIKNALNVLLHDLGIFVDLEKEVELCFPLAIELCLFDHINLHLRVEWASGVIEEFHLHRFHYSRTDANGNERDYENERLEFIEALLKHPGIEQRFLCDENNAAQCLVKMGLKGELGDIFVEYANRNAATLRFKRKTLEDIAETKLRALVRQIEGLEHARWDIRCISSDLI